ncbi:hypothetical protein [Actinomadura bangladeshensis]|uniref:Uncharacterized protein n=1 Tax=Actinomadura bangladeshensis TaxID=453573 RepID=A0A6L9QFZ5_9ACTN|nr:hypothetical protein [Actinomadura bangladeshensis]NEA23024.1 hypothetical protein [Actinomadura bangladeshensis]
MSDFDDLVAAERRRIEGEAAARAAGENRRRHGELPEWQQVVGRVQELLAASARHLREAGVPPIPVLEERGVNQRLELWGLLLVGRVVIVGHRWQLGPFDLDAEGRVYPTNRTVPLIPAYPLSDNPARNKKMRKARLRTGVAADQQVMWASGDAFVLDPVVGVETGRVACFGKGADGAPVLLAGESAASRPLQPVLAEAVARCIAQSGRR